MKYFRNILSILIFVFLVTFGLQAQPVESEDVLSISENFISVFFKDDPRKIEDISTKASEGQTLIYIVNLNPEGWILVSGNKGASPVIGFNYTGSFVFPEENIMNPAYNWLSQSAEQVQNLYSEPSEDEHPTWSEGFEYVLTKSTKSVSPFIDADWGQGTGYNQFCPTSATGPDGKALVGCVAVAMAQALSVFEVPDQGSGRNTYTHASYGVITNDFSESFYKWDSMLNDSPNQYNALLLYDCATAVDMNFGGSASSATTADAAAALAKHFGMAETAMYLSRDQYSTSVWTDRIILNIENRLPIIYRGRHDDGGHAFNVDGVVNSNFFHINWGWYGNANGYFLLDDLSPGSRTYNDNQAAIFRIQPANAVSVKSNFEEDLLTIYPNPTSSIVRIQNISGDQIEKISVFSINGLLLKSIDGSSVSEYIDLSDLRTGMYILEARLNEKTIIRKKIIKQ